MQLEVTMENDITILQEILDVWPIFVALAAAWYWLNNFMNKVTKALDKLAHEHSDIQLETQLIKDKQSREAENINEAIKGIIKEHSEHDKQNTRIETKIDHNVGEIKEIRKLINELIRRAN